VPEVTIVTPVYNRREPLRTALASLRDQTFSDFECLVIDDASTIDVEDIVASFDDRFVYVRRDQNGGCTSARFDGYDRMAGRILFHLDSDNTYFPWALERGVQLLDEHPHMAGVAGLYVFDDGLRVRIPEGQRVVTPREWCSSVGSSADSVAAVRRLVVDEWIADGDCRGYFNVDFALWLSFHMRHDLLLVDEPWGRYDSGGSDRLTGSSDKRAITDAVSFTANTERAVGVEACAPLDVFLRRRWRYLSRSGCRREADQVAAYLARRGISRRNLITTFALEKARRVIHR
jgi:glycosyltransferase involved in cell wall biosynthesis